MSKLFKGKDAKVEAAANLFPFFLPFHLPPLVETDRRARKSVEAEEIFSAFEPPIPPALQNAKQYQKKKKTTVLRPSGDISCYNHESKRGEEGWGKVEGGLCGRRTGALG